MPFVFVWHVWVDCQFCQISKFLFFKNFIYLKVLICLLFTVWSALVRFGWLYSLQSSSVLNYKLYVKVIYKVGIQVSIQFWKRYAEKKNLENLRWMCPTLYFLVQTENVKCWFWCTSRQILFYVLHHIRHVQVETWSLLSFSKLLLNRCSSP